MFGQTGIFFKFLLKFFIFSIIFQVIFLLNNISFDENSNDLAEVIFLGLPGHLSVALVLSIPLVVLSLLILLLKSRLFVFLARTYTLLVTIGFTVVYVMYIRYFDSVGSVLDQYSLITYFRTAVGLFENSFKEMAIFMAYVMVASYFIYRPIKRKLLTYYLSESYNRLRIAQIIALVVLFGFIYNISSSMERELRFMGHNLSNENNRPFINNPIYNLINPDMVVNYITDPIKNSFDEFIENFEEEHVVEQEHLDTL